MAVLVESHVRASPALIVTAEIAVADPVVVYRYWIPVGLMTPMETVAPWAKATADQIKNPSVKFFRVSGIHHPLGLTQKKRTTCFSGGWSDPKENSRNRFIA